MGKLRHTEVKGLPLQVSCSVEFAESEKQMARVRARLERLARHRPKDLAGRLEEGSGQQMVMVAPVWIQYETST